MTRSAMSKKVALLSALLAMAMAVAGLSAWCARLQLRFWWLFEPLGKNAQGLPEYRHRQTGIVMVRLPGGKFWMGAQKTDPNGQNYDPEAEDDEGPVHEVALSPFLIAKYEVTQAQWEKVVERSPPFFRGADLPVIFAWSPESLEFFRKTGLKLPTEAQWEYACRAGTSGAYGGTGRLKDMGWYRGSSRAYPVGEKQPNGFGLHDLHGNVSELCEDLYDEGFYPTPEARRKDPVCASGSEWRVRRGGCLLCNASRCRSAFRFNPLGIVKELRTDCVGIRPAYYPLP